jgi:hypothetical protein
MKSFGSVRRVLAVGILSGAYFVCPQAASASVLVSADGPGNTYELIEGKGFGLELPDCGHPVRHIREVFDSTLNKNVFAMDIHRDLDDDRCNGSTDRQRNEVKTAPGGGDTNTLECTQGQTCYYRWKFKLDSGVQPSSSFFHIHQIKADSGGDEGSPIFTITLRKGSPDLIQFIYTAPAGGSGSGTKAQTSLVPFKGVWVEAFVTHKASDSGFVNAVIKRVSDGATLISWNSGTIDTWRSSNTFNRGKWGLYRSLNDVGSLRDETMLINDWCVTETAGECPSSIGSATPTPTPRPTATPTPGATATPTPGPTATPTPGSGFTGYYKLIAHHSGKALVVQSASTSDSAAVIQWTYGGTSTNDEWSLVSLGGGYYRVMNRNSGKAMAVASASTSSGALVIQFTYGGTATNDEWQVNNLGTGYYSLINRNSGKSVDVKSASTSDGAVVQQSTWSNVSQQQFQIISVP